MTEVPNDPTDPSLVVEIRSFDDNGESWHPLWMTAEGDNTRAALVKTTQRDSVVAKLEVVHGKGNVRTVPVDGYGTPLVVPYHAPPEVRAQLHDGPVIPTTAVPCRLCCGVVSLHFENPADPTGSGLHFAIQLDKRSVVIIDTADPDNPQPVWPLPGTVLGSEQLAALRTGLSTIAQWMIAKLETAMRADSASAAEPARG